MKRPKHKYLLLLLDEIVILYSFLIALKLHTRLNIEIFSNGIPFVSPVALFFFAYSGVILFTFYANQLYKINIYLSVAHQLQRIFKSLIYTIIGIAIISFFTKSPLIIDSRLIILYFFISSSLLLIVVRILLFRPLYKFCCSHGIINRSALILGAGKTGKRLASVLARSNPLGLRLLGFLDDVKEEGTIILKDVRVIGRLNDVIKIAIDQHVNEIILCLENESEERSLEITDLCAQTNARVLIGSALFNILHRYIFQERYDNVPVFGIMNSHAYLGKPVLKRMLDFVLASFGLIILMPVFLIISIAIKMNSPGPVLFRQTRIGKNGIPFTFYKFRSMCLGSDCDEDREYKLKEFIQESTNSHIGSTKIVNPQKITRVGRFLRKTSLDELPQLLNVIKGDMSLVGPRPCLPYEWNSYSEWHKKRLSVTPGCTGTWQVFARSKVGFRDMTIIDLFYVYNISFPLDIWLILKTVPVMLFGSGGK